MTSRQLHRMVALHLVPRPLPVGHHPASEWPRGSMLGHPRPVHRLRRRRRPQRFSHYHQEVTTHFALHKNAFTLTTHMNVTLCLNVNTFFCVTFPRRLLQAFPSYRKKYIKLWCLSYDFALWKANRPSNSRLVVAVFMLHFVYYQLLQTHSLHTHLSCWCCVDTFASPFINRLLPPKRNSTKSSTKISAQASDPIQLKVTQQGRIPSSLHHPLSFIQSFMNLKKYVRKEKLNAKSIIKRNVSPSITAVIISAWVWYQVELVFLLITNIFYVK